MKHIRGMLMGVAAIAALGAGNLLAQEKSPYTISFNAGFVDQYLWRGFVANDTPSLQPELRFGYKGFSAASWSNFSHTAPYGRAWTEHTLHLAYARRFGDLTASFGWRSKVFPNLNWNSHPPPRKRTLKRAACVWTSTRLTKKRGNLLLSPFS